MPKMKTHKGTKKRFRLSASGLPKHRQAGTSHLATGLSNKRRRNLRGTRVLDKAMSDQIHRALRASSMRARRPKARIRPEGGGG